MKIILQFLLGFSIIKKGNKILNKLFFITFFSSKVLPPLGCRYKVRLSLLILFFAFAFNKETSASHAAGGYVSYQWLSGNTYRLTVTFYRDCSGIAAPDSMEIDLSSSCGDYYIDAPQVPPSGTEIGYPCPVSTTCNGGSNPGFQKYIYQVDAIFPKTCSDWVLSFQPSNTNLQILGRNSIITTLNTPLGNIYTETKLNNVNYPTNSSVTFINDPVLFICAGQPAVFNLGATDSNGDSLYYDLVTAKKSALSNVSYVSPLSGTNPLFPGAGAVTINHFTGDVTINTSTIQVGVIDVLVKEYKNGVFVGSVVLDIQVIVQSCSNNYPTLSGINGASVFTDSVCAGSTISFNINSNDLDASQIVSMTWNSGIPAPASFSSSGSPFPVGTFTWATTAGDARSQPYTFTVSVKDNACPTNGFQTRAYSIYVISPVITISPTTPIVCSGQSVSLTAGGGSTYSWSPSSGLSATSGATVLASPASTTTYTVTGTDAGGCANTKTVTVNVNPKPAILVSPAAAVICNGQSVSLSASGGTGYVWSPSAGLSSSTGSIVSAGPSVTTTYTVSGTDANGCTNTTSVTVTVNALPAITANPAASVLCNGQSVSLTAGGANTYVWSPSAGLSATTGTIVSASPSATTSYTVTGTDANGCSNTKSLTVTINPLPAIAISPSNPILCNGQSVSLTAGGAVSYIWNPTTGLSSGTGATVNASPSSTTTYTVSGTDVNGCTNTKSITVTVNALPAISANPSLPVLCNGQSVSLTATGATTYNWSPSAGLSATTGATVSANPSATTTYTVSGTDANGCVNTKNVTVTVNPLPLITASPVAPVLCNGQSVSLTAGGGSTYSWTPSTGLSSITGSAVSANPSSTTTYTVTGTDANGCSNTKSVTVTVNSLPDVSASPVSTVLCSGQSVLLTAAGANSYAWSPSTGLSSTTGSNVSATPLLSTTYTVTGTDGNGCSNTKNVTINVNPLPLITASPVSSVLCSGQSVSLTAAGGSTYVWSPSLGLSASTGSTVSANPSSTTTYTVIGTDANGCTNSKSVTVTINQLPVITGTPPSSSLCNGASVALTASGGTSYIWTPSTGLSATTGSSVSASPSTTTTYSITGTDANGCSNTASVTVSVVLNPAITINPVAPVVCNGQSVSLTAGGANSYVWSPSSGLSATTGATVSANPSSTATYTVIGTVAGGCTSTKSVTVTVNSLPVISVNPTTAALCNGQSVALIAGGGNAYVWSPSTGLSSGSGPIVSASPISTTVYTVTGSDANGCTNTATVNLTVNQLPVITVSPSAIVLCNGKSATLAASGGATYNWNPLAGLSAGTGSIVTASPSANITYQVTGTDGNGCSSTASVNVTVNPNPVITVTPAEPAICLGSSVAIAAGGGVNYSWNPATGLSSATGSSVSASPAITTSYVVTGTDANGCSNTANVNVKVNSLPAITASPSAPVICNGKSVSITASGGVSYDWTPATGLSSVNGASVTASPSVTTTYIVAGADVNGCTGTDTLTVTVNPLPVIAASPAASVLCNGQSVAITASGGASYAWSPTAGLSSASGASVTANPINTTAYTVTGTDVNGCSNTANVTVTVNKLPVITATPPTPSICNGQSVALTASGAASYSWTPAAGLSSASGSNVIASPTANSSYVVTGTDVNGCSSTATITLTVNPLPVITVNPATPAICAGKAVLLAASGGVSYSWSPTLGLSSGSGASVTASPTATSTYYVIGTDAYGCSNTTPLTVKVNQLPFVNAGPDANICPSASTQLNVTGPPPGSIYIWTPSVGLSCNNCSNPSANPLTTTNYIVSVTDSAGCTANDTVAVIVTPLSAVAGPDTSVCYGSFVQLNASGGSNYLWTPSVNLSDPVIPDPSLIALTSTTYTVTVSLGSCSSTSTVSIHVYPVLPTPMVSQSMDTLFCSYDPLYFSYQWYYGNSLIPNATNSYYKALQSGNYNVAVTDKYGCSISVGINIVLNVGLSDLGSTSNSISIYPNPASDKLFISGGGINENSTLAIYNVVGEKIMEQRVGQDDHSLIDIRNLSAGIYFIEVRFWEGKWTGKFVKE